jgi:hypothetical protein
MLLPKERIKRDITNPKLFIIYGMAKVGKTVSTAQLEDCLIVDLRKETDHLKEGLWIKVNSIAELEELGKEIINQGKPYKYISIDNIKELELWCEDLGTKLYKASTIGKNFRGANVLDLPNGAGYRWLRIAFNKVIDYVETWAENIILIGHVKEKLLGHSSGIEFSATDLNLSGQLNQIICSRADTIGYMYRKTVGADKGSPVEELRISFKARADLNCGTRVEHLRGKDILFDWNEIYKA